MSSKFFCSTSNAEMFFLIFRRNINLRDMLDKGFRGKKFDKKRYAPS